MQPAPRRVPAVLFPLALVFAMMLAPTPAAAVSQATVSIEVELTRLLDAERRAHGLHPLRVDVRLLAGSRSWSAEMARRGGLAHDPHLSFPPGTTRGAESIGSTTATTGIAGALHRAFLGSARHRANMLDAGSTDVGVGVEQAGGKTYVTVRFTAGAGASVAPAVTVLAGLAGQAFPGGAATHAVVTRDDVFADALAAGPLAGGSGPVLLTPPGPAVHPDVRMALEHSLPKGRIVWLIGGVGAVSDGVAQELRGAGWDVRRIGGANRIQTAASVARQVVAQHGRPSTVLIATAWNWPDAAAGGAFGAADRAPVLLSNASSVPGETLAALRDFAPGRVAALGGRAVLSDDVVNQLGARRVSGSSRQGTAAAVARDLWRYRDATPSTWIAVPAAGDDAWTWALGVTPVAARSSAAVLLVGPEVSGQVRGYLTGLGYGRGRGAELLVYGPVPGAAAEQIRSLLR